MYRAKKDFLDLDVRKIYLCVPDDHEGQKKSSYIAIDMDSIAISEEILEKMRKIPNFDYINEICRSEILLKYLKDTKQRALVTKATNINILMSGKWRDVFRF